ncbi:hypothetical protein BKH42_02705 [Helicobacter sp. 13S00482-2]|uniref:hypothetical protein n=1 Tax=Helicobacter sp. 13S00482-2 TaxID=1476200 RepID=UPI000BA6AF24|nr:hypothetical protein [Helicobacter sp. 13S00482-2]PAF54140.1 hypothetical protein BKH42_02705 [Helicobacter sp. 13S00482-2]
MPLFVYRDYKKHQAKLNEDDAYDALKKQYQSILDTKTFEGKKLKKQGIQKLKYAIKMLDDPQVEKFVKSMNEDISRIPNERYINYSL